MKTYLKSPKIAGKQYTEYVVDVKAYLTNIKKKVSDGRYEVKIGKLEIDKNWLIFLQPNKNFIAPGAFGIYNSLHRALFCSHHEGAVDNATYNFFQNMKTMTKITKKVSKK